MDLFFRSSRRDHDIPTIMYPIRDFQSSGVALALLVRGRGRARGGGGGGGGVTDRSTQS